jgi:hypothetical protein
VTRSILKVSPQPRRPRSRPPHATARLP